MSEPSAPAIRQSIEMCGADADSRTIITVAAVIDDPIQDFNEAFEEWHEHSQQSA